MNAVLLALTFLLAASTHSPGDGASVASTPASERNVPGEVLAVLANLGTVPYSHLSMLFEATMFRLDVAVVEAFLPAETADRLGGIVTSESVDGSSVPEGPASRIASVVMEADPVVFRLTFLRDLGWGRFLDRTRGNLHAAVESGEWTEEQFERIWPTVEEAFSPLEKRGVLEGDALYYVVSEERVHSLYYSPESELLVEFEQSGEDRAGGTRAAFFAPGSEFREKLFRSLWDPAAR